MNMLRSSLCGGASTLLMPNVWDARSALIAQQSGFSVVGTSSAAIAATLGGDDAEQTPRNEMLDWIRRIVRVVDPTSVNADLEAGYGLTAVEIAEVVRDLGCAGINLEDTDHGGNSQFDSNDQARKLAELSVLLNKLPDRPVLTARVDSLLDVIHDGGLGDSVLADERVEDCIERAHAYLHAGVDVVFPIGLNTKRQMRRFLAQVPVRNTALLIPFLDNRIAFLRGLGISRISFGGTPREASDEVSRRRLRNLGENRNPVRSLVRSGSQWLGRQLVLATPDEGLRRFRNHQR